MKSRIKILLHKEWLRDFDATALLGGLIESRVSDEDFIDLIRGRRLVFYVNCSELIDSHKARADAARSMLVHTTNGETATIPGDQMVQVLSPQLTLDYGPGGNNLAFDCARYGGRFEGLSDEALSVQWCSAHHRAGTRSEHGCYLYVFFKTSDIQALADVMNGAASSVGCDVAALKGRIARLEDENAKLRAASNTPDGLVFPYSTPELEVMRDMAVKYWTSYNAETDRKPLQKQIGIEISEIMNWTLSGGSAPSRQATSLATAIQPKQHRGN